MPVIRVDQEAYNELQKRANSPPYDFNDAIKKLLGLKTTSKGLPQTEYWIPVLRVLVEKGGSASSQEARASVESRLRGRFSLKDYQSLKGAVSPRWWKRTRNARLKMIYLGLMSASSPFGVWEITDKGRRWLLEHTTQSDEQI